MRKTFRYLLAAWALCLVAAASAQTQKGQGVYKVKKKDTVFGIARKYGITMPELMEANPQMKAEGYELKKGDSLVIPFPKGGAAAHTPTVAPGAKAAATHKISVGIMLPLHDVDGDGRRMVEYYRGFLLGLEDLAEAGVSAEVHAWNVNIDADISRVTQDPAAARCDVIFGPLYTHQVRGLAEFCKARGIRLVIPFSISGDDVARYPQIYQVWESADKLNNSAIEAFLERFSDAHPVFIDCNDAASAKGIFTFALRNRLDGKRKAYSITNLNNSEAMFAKAFRVGVRNVVVLNTGRSPELNIALAKLESLKNNLPSLRISLFGYNEWMMYTENNLERFHRFDTYIPGHFYYNPLDAATRRLEQTYRRWFRRDMQHALPRFALVGYDQARFFVGGISKYGAGFNGTAGQAVYTPLQSPLRFRQVGTAGMQNEFFQLIHYAPGGRIESIAY